MSNTEDSFQNNDDEEFTCYEHCILCDRDFEIIDNFSHFFNEKFQYYTVTKMDCPIYRLHKKLINKKVEEFGLDKSKLFGLDMRGYIAGLYVAKFPLPDNWSEGNVICGNCLTFQGLHKEYCHIWSH